MSTANRKPLTRYFINLSFRRKLLLIYLIVLLIPVAVFGSIAYEVTRARYWEQAIRSINIQVDEQTDKIDGRIQQAEQALYSFALNERMISSLQREYESFYAFVEEYTNNIAPSFTISSKLNPNLIGWRLYTNGPLSAYGSLATPVEGVDTEPWFQALMTRKGIVWHTRGKLMNASTWQVCVFNPRLINVIQFHFNMQAMFADTELSAVEHMLQVRDAEGRVVYGWDGFAEPLAPDMQQTEIDVQGERTSVFSRALSPAGWRLYYFVPSSQLSFGSTLLVVLMAAFLTLAVLLSSAGVIFSRTLIHRMESLNAKVKRAAGADSTQELRTDANDEIGQLSNSVAAMLEESRCLQKKMYESKLALREAELTALQAQIKPHFLYNSLSLINWYAIRIDNSEISEIALMLCQFYRTMLNHGQMFISVREEWMNVEAYLAIQQMFHNHLLTVEASLSPEAESCLIPHFIVQPLIENAIEHGVDKRKSKGGMLRFFCRLEGDAILWQVEDDGPGFVQEDPQSAIHHKAKGYGLSNVDDRLRILYGDRYHILLENRPEGGARVTLILPKQAEENP